MALFKKLLRKDNNDLGGGRVVAHTQLIARHLDKNGKEIERRVVKNKVVTNAFVYDLVDVLTGTSGKFDLYKWHDSGISTAAEAATNTALTSRISTSRTAGTQVEATATSNAYKSIATHTYGSSYAVTEHGLFNSSSTAAGIAKMMDRTKFAVINVVSGNSIEFTFTITFTAGG